MNTVLGKQLIPICDLEKWSAKRLLRFYKSYRGSLIDLRPTSDYHYSEDAQLIKDWTVLQKYVDDVKELLNKREHVSN